MQEWKNLKRKRKKKSHKGVVAKQAKLDMYSQPRNTWRTSVVVSSDESDSDEGEHAGRDNTNPRAGVRVQQLIGRMQDRGVQRRAALARLRQARALTNDRRHEAFDDCGGLSAAECTAWCRICRPGAVVGDRLVERQAAVLACKQGGMKTVLSRRNNVRRCAHLVKPLANFQVCLHTRQEHRSFAPFISFGDVFFRAILV